MKTIESRHKYILEKLNKNETVQVAQLSKILEVSEVTIRKDLKFLENKGFLFRTHGGAMRTNPYIQERPIDEKEHIRFDEKRRIGMAASNLVAEGDAIIIASGTTVLFMVRNLPAVLKCRVITASLNIAIELSRHEGIEVFQLGGNLRKSSLSTVGPSGEAMLENFSCNRLFMGIDGLDLDFGLTTTSLQEAHLNHKMMKAAKRTIVLSDSSKFGRRGFGRICGLEEVDQIITDKNVSEKYIQYLEEKGVKVTLT